MWISRKKYNSILNELTQLQANGLELHDMVNKCNSGAIVYGSGKDYSKIVMVPVDKFNGLCNDNEKLISDNQRLSNRCASYKHTIDNVKNALNKITNKRVGKLRAVQIVYDAVDRAIDISEDKEADYSMHHWIKKEGTLIECSNCGFQLYNVTDKHIPYCEQCGKYMFSVGVEIAGGRVYEGE